MFHPEISTRIATANLAEMQEQAASYRRARATRAPRRPVAERARTTLAAWRSSLGRTRRPAAVGCEV